MGRSNITIKAGSGRYTLLDKKYNDFVNAIDKNDQKLMDRWNTYEFIMAEMIYLGKVNLFEEIKYRVTGGENPAVVISEIIKRDDEVHEYLWSQLDRLKRYELEDLMERFK